MFSWMQKKLHGKNGNKKSLNSSNTPFNKNALQERCREEFNDWPNALLAIGTFGGNKVLKENRDDMSNLVDEENQTSSQDNLTLEEVRQIEKELGLLDSDKLVNCIASLDINRSNGTDECCEGSNTRGTRRLQRSSSEINKKSLSFLLKKMFVCRSRLATIAPALNLKDPLPESRFEKILRAIIHKKIHPQSPSPKMRSKKYLKNRSQMAKEEEEEETDEEVEVDNGSRWVKTDSEYIVLEM